MPQESELIQAILQAPDDDGPRLAYADWSGQQPEDWRKGRAEFIRCQVSFSRLPQNTDPRLLYALLQDAEDLEKAYSQFWDRNVAGLAGGLFYDRGFIELVTMETRQFLERGEQLKSLSPIRHLNLSQAAPLARELFASPLLRGIRSLDLTDNGLGDAEMAMLAASPYLTELRWLSLVRNNVGETGAASLAMSKGLPQLGYVYFMGNRVEPNEEYSFDTGMVVDSGLPESGLKLEKRFGHLRWLHYAASGMDDRAPNRFRMPPVM